MVLHVLDALAELDVTRVVVVVGHRGAWVTKTLTEAAPPGVAIDFVEQPSPRGTGDATAVALTAVPEDHDELDVLVLPGDAPLLRAPTLAALVRRHRARAAAGTLLTAEVDDPTGYGRLARDQRGEIVGVVEEADADEDERASHEINTSVYCFRRNLLAPSLRRLTPANAQGEYYLTDVVAVLHEAGHPVESLRVDDPMEVAGVNDRAQLAAAEAELRARINERWMRRGVTMWDPEHTYVDAGVHLEADVTLRPGVVLRGACEIGSAAEIGPQSTLVDTRVGREAEVIHTVARRAEVGTRARVGPYAVLEEGAFVGDGAVVPPFVVVGDAGRSEPSG
jgi:bifunctional UDP-N-acetylglucosamine pyrophosphorylase / glucosamine-1-phosphate N-acetyltransferase